MGALHRGRVHGHQQHHDPHRPERIVIAGKQREAGIGAPGDPIIAMEMHDFGDNAAVMISQHFPYRGGKPYRNVRVWVLRDGRWQLVISLQSTIQSANRSLPERQSNNRYYLLDSLNYRTSMLCCAAK